MENKFSRLERAIGKSALEILKKSRVAVFGIGGVGGHAVEALVRGGVGSLYIVDSDTVCESNLNRQIIALKSTMGMYKTEVMRQRILDINDEATVDTDTHFFTEERADSIDFSSLDYCIDAIDTVSSKLSLIKTCKKANVPIISCMGTGFKLYPEKLTIGDIYSTSVCPLARVMRRELKKAGVEHLTVLYSTEQPIIRENDGERVIGSVSFVPSVAGLMMAGHVIKELIKVSDTTF